MHSQQRSSHQKCQDEQGAPGKTQTQKGSHREDGSKDRQPGKNSEIVWAAKDWARKDKALTELGDYRLSLRPVLGGDHGADHPGNSAEALEAGLELKNVFPLLEAVVPVTNFL